MKRRNCRHLRKRMSRPAERKRQIIVNEQAQAFIIDLFGKLRERMIDLRSGKAVFVGGGSILLKKHIEASGKVSLPIFVDEISANTKGYELLFKAACMG